jgi:hypothetical protein
LGLLVLLAAGCNGQTQARGVARKPVATSASLSEPAPIRSPASPGGVTQADFEAAVAGVDPEAVDRLLAKLPHFSDDEGHAYIIFEGDLPYTEQGVRAAIENERAKRQARRATNARPELKLELGNPGERLFWARSERHLTYAVDRASFASAPPGAFDSVVQNIEAAATQWEGLCAGCGLTIRHRADLDGKIDRSKVTFVVRYSAAATDEIALAFFPGAPADQRTLWVYTRYPTTHFDRTGVFRHELGHVLGYAHEHLDTLSSCAKTSDSWTPITRYDAKSVMHYVCGDEGSLQLAFTDCDKKGHLRVYNLPAGAPPPISLPPLDCQGTPL